MSPLYLEIQEMLKYLFLSFSHHLSGGNVSSLMMFNVYIQCFPSISFTLDNFKCYLHKNGLLGFASFHKFLLSILKFSIVFQSHCIFIVDI